MQYATALYFGIGTPPDREQALRMFRELAKDGNADAVHFLRHGYHTAWRQQDGSLYVDPDWSAGQAGTRADASAEREHAKVDGTAEGLHREHVSSDGGLPASALSRDAVQAELARSKQDGSYASLHSEFRRPDEGLAGAKNREQVQRELQESITDSVWQARKLELYTY